jgi:hypothetical protein
MSDAVKILPHYTYHDYENWEGRWELIDGIPYAMQPLSIPARRHRSSTDDSIAYFNIVN